MACACVSSQALLPGKAGGHKFPTFSYFLHETLIIFGCCCGCVPAGESFHRGDVLAKGWRGSRLAALWCLDLIRVGSSLTVCVPWGPGEKPPRFLSLRE